MRSAGMPMPVSRTDPRSSVVPASSSCHVRLTHTSPSVVNLTALLIRFTSTWRSRALSPMIRRGTASSIQYSRSTPLSRAAPQHRSSASSRHAASSNGSRSSSNWPDSSREKSRMPLISAIKVSPLVRMIPAYSSCAGDSGVCSSRSLMPITAFIGVRISWLMLARNSALARLPASAASRAAISSASVRLRAVMSRAMPSRPVQRPAWSRMATLTSS